MKKLPLLLLLCSVVFMFGAAPIAEKPAITIATVAVKGRLTRMNFEDSIRSLYDRIGLEQQGLKFEIFRLGMVGYHSLKAEGKLGTKQLISFIDFNKKSTEKRFYTIDLGTYKLLFHSLVSHGKNTGENEARFFSNTPHSNQSSLGFYVTGEIYTGSKGYSMRLDGVDGRYNSNMRARAVVMHDAAYVSEEWVRKYGRLGRSQGCPALPKEISQRVIDTIHDRTLIFAYFDDQNYLASSAHLDIESLFKRLDAIEQTADQFENTTASAEVTR